jgi:hypothetical protein
LQLTLALGKSVGADSIGAHKLRGERAMKYRRKNGSDTWHFCTNCSKWPTSDYVERDTKPTTGELDNECMAKDNNGTCMKKQ